MSFTEVVVALAIAVGLLGILVPILPGGAAGPRSRSWSGRLDVGGATAWAVFAVVARPWSPPARS